MGIVEPFACAKFRLAAIFCAVLSIYGFAQQASIPSNAIQSVHDETPVAETVRGTLNIVAVDPAGATKSQPADLTSWTINAWVQDRNGSYSKLAGKGNGNGTFAIAGVPAGSYWLEYGCSKCSPALAPEFDEIDNRRPVLGHYVAVPRPNLKSAAKGVALDFSVTGVPCYPPEAAIGWHDFVWWFPNAAASQVVGGKDQLSFLDPCENPGIFSSASQWSGPLMNAAFGDSGYLLGYAFAVGPNPELEIWDEEFVAAGYSSEPLTMPDGKALEVAGAANLSGVPGPQIQYSRFAALEHGSWSATSCTALPQWMGGQYGFLFPAPEEFFYRIMNHAVPPETIGCGGQTLSLSNPFPTATLPLVYYFEDAGANNKNWAATAGSEIAPTVGPPTMVQLDGQDSFEHGGPTKQTPTLSWSDPVVGQANLYLVYLNRPRSTVLFTTRGRRLTVPPGILLPGDSYSLSLVAVYDGAGCAGNGDARLCEMSLEQGGAQLFSGILEVPLPDGALARSKPLPNADDAQFGGNIAWQLRRHRERQEHIWTRFYELEATRD